MEAGKTSDSASIPASQSQASATTKKKTKTHINVDGNGLPQGELSEKLATRVGELVRTHCPISYLDWRRVPKNFKEDVWNVLMEKNEGIKIKDHAVSWMKAHEMKGGGVDPASVEIYEQLKAAGEKRKTMSEEESSIMLGFDSDVLAEVYGPDNGKAYVRGYSSYISKKHAQLGVLATSLIDREVNKSNAHLEAKIDNFTKYIEGCMKTKMQQFQSQHVTQTTVGDCTVSPKTGSNSIHPTSRRNLDPVIQGNALEDTHSGSQMAEKAYVNLLNRDGVVVGMGYIVTGEEGKFCHNRKVLPTEKKVRIEVVYDINAPLPDPPQGDGEFTLGGFSEGGWLIWLESRLQRIS